MTGLRDKRFGGKIDSTALELGRRANRYPSRVTLNGEVGFAVTCGCRQFVMRAAEDVIGGERVTAGPFLNLAEKLLFDSPIFTSWWWATV